MWLISNEALRRSSRCTGRHAAYGSGGQKRHYSRPPNVGPAKLQTLAEPMSLSDSPMGEDNELVAANTVEQIARRLNFRPEALNQIKTAIVEACINAFEHSFSPDRKIYQRFRVESDRLTITIASRGVTPASVSAKAADDRERRGWGLQLIRTLMDEVEFERVDEGTSLRMTKYVSR